MAAVARRILVAGAYEPVAKLALVQLESLDDKNMQIILLEDEDETRTLPSNFACQLGYNDCDKPETDLSSFEAIMIVLPRERECEKLFNLIHAYKRAKGEAKFLLVVGSLIDDGDDKRTYDFLLTLLRCSGIPFSFLNVAFLYQYLLPLISARNRRPCIELPLGRRQLDLVDVHNVAQIIRCMLVNREPNHIITIVGEKLRTGESIASDLAHALKCPVDYRMIELSEVGSNRAGMYPDSQKSIAMVTRYSNSCRLNSDGTPQILENPTPLRDFFMENVESIKMNLGDDVDYESEISGGWEEVPHQHDQFGEPSTDGMERGAPSFERGDQHITKKRDSGIGLDECRDIGAFNTRSRRVYDRNQIDTLLTGRIVDMCDDTDYKVGEIEHGFTDEIEKQICRFRELRESLLEAEDYDGNFTKPLKVSASDQKKYDRRRRRTLEDADRHDFEFYGEDGQYSRRASQGRLPNDDANRQEKSTVAFARDLANVSEKIRVHTRAGKEWNERKRVQDAQRQENKQTFFQNFAQRYSSIVGGKNANGQEHNEPQGRREEFCGNETQKKRFYKPLPELDVTDRRLGSTALRRFDSDEDERKYGSLDRRNDHRQGNDEYDRRGSGNVADRLPAAPHQQRFSLPNNTEDRRYYRVSASTSQVSGRGRVSSADEQFQRKTQVLMI